MDAAGGIAAGPQVDRVQAAGGPEPQEVAGGAEAGAQEVQTRGPGLGLDLLEEAPAQAPALEGGVDGEANDPCPALAGASARPAWALRVWGNRCPWGRRRPS